MADEAVMEAALEVAAMAEAVGNHKTYQPNRTTRNSYKMIPYKCYPCVEYIILDNITSIYYVCFILPFLGLKEFYREF
jgi:hypothetical protein